MNISSSFSCAEAFYVKIVLLAVIVFICSFNICKNKDWTKLVYKFRVQMRFSFSPCCTIWDVLHLLLFCITFRLICSAALSWNFTFRKVLRYPHCPINSLDWFCNVIMSFRLLIGWEYHHCSSSFRTYILLVFPDMRPPHILDNYIVRNWSKLLGIGNFLLQLSRCYFFQAKLSCITFWNLRFIWS